MKSEKVTTRAERWYDDACGSAHGLELIGERWSLLIVRELMFGPRRFGELRGGLPGISANVLTQRLAGLAAAGIVRRETLPPPASVQVYALTDWGYEADAVLMVLGRWAARSPDHDPALPLSAASLMLSFRTMFDAERAGGAHATLAFRFGPDRLIVTIAAGTLTARRGEAPAPDVTLTGTPAAVAALVYGGVPPAALGDALHITGDEALLTRFATWFPLPAKAG